MEGFKWEELNGKSTRGLWWFGVVSAARLQASLVAQWYQIHLPVQETGLIPRLGRTSGERNVLTLVFLPGRLQFIAS